MLAAILVNPRANMKTAVILSTYNAPDRLAPTLVGYAAQSHRNFELIVADDGSTVETRTLIREISSQHGLPIKHVWQEDIGFRKCRILNQAIASTHADYLIFSDGDCIPRADFVATHVERALPGRFLSGGYFKLSAEASARITHQDILAGNALDPQWLSANGMPRSRKLGRLVCSPWRARLMNAITPTSPTWNGHNSSGWRSDMLRINGFDERMAYWAQDREFGERLVNSGVRGLQIRYSAICVHLHHERPYKTDASRERNRQIRRETRHHRARWTMHGLHNVPEPQHAHTALATADDVSVMSYA
jgi:glycosyltransferase involved in cell wall biosynthesis